MLNLRRHTTPNRSPHEAALRTRWAAIGAAVAVTHGAAGIGGYNIVNAEVSSGERAVLVAIDSCRFADTRAGEFNVGPRALPLGEKETHTFSSQQSGVSCTGKIPATATALSLNVTATQATQPSFLTIWSGGTLPDASSLNPTPGEPPVPNAVTVPLASGNTFNIYNKAGTVEVIIDVVGYYEDHNHDDRYYTRDQVDAVAQERVNAGTSGFLTASQVGEVAQERINAQPANDTILRADPADFVRVQEGTSWTFGGAAFHTSTTTTPECIAAPIRAAAGTEVTSISIRYTSVTGTTSGSVSLSGFRSSPGPIDFGGEGSSTLVNNGSVEFFSDAGATMRNVEVLPTGTPTFVVDHVMTLQVCTAAQALAIVTAIVNTA